MLERPERLASRRLVLLLLAAACCLLLAALFCCFSFDWKLLLFRTCGFWHTHPSPTAEGRAVQWRCILYIMLISLCVVMGIRTFHTVLPPQLRCFDTVRSSRGANLVGCRGQREQSMVGPHQGATLNLAGIAGLPRFQPSWPFSCCCYCCCRSPGALPDCTMNDAVWLCWAA